MRTTIDRLGRIVVPKPLRDRLRLRGGEALDIEERDGVLELRIAHNFFDGQPAGILLAVGSSYNK